VPGFKIRRAALKDLDVLVEHRNAMFDEYTHLTPEEHEVADTSYPVWARELMKQGLFHGYVVETAGGKVAASGCVWLRQQQPSRGSPASLVPYVMSIYTNPQFRRRGLASMIVEEAMAWSKKHGYRKMTLHASLAGRKVYSQLGWKRTWEMEIRFDELRRSARLTRGAPPRFSKPSPNATRRRRGPSLQ
jgi:ribosomal protein S18 acetylase RimI-like enzyme